MKVYELEGQNYKWIDYAVMMGTISEDWDVAYALNHMIESNEQTRENLYRFADKCIAEKVS